MCGIAGILGFDNYSVTCKSVCQMANMMKHRGPDDEGFLAITLQNNDMCAFGGADTVSRAYNLDVPYRPQKKGYAHKLQNNRLVLGHRRLAIVDLSAAGHQPMSTEDRRYWIIYNGEVYNYKEIRETLIKQGERFFSSTDTEVVLRSYVRWGPDCLTRFNGMWAFAIWDNYEKTLFCSRDRIGIKPFYYYIDQRLFAFASDIDALKAADLFDVSPDPSGVYHAMSFYCAPRPFTCYKNIFSLEQGHWMKIDTAHRVIKKRYWSIPVGEIDERKTEDQWVEELDAVLRKAVSRRLIADVPVGTFMSGGVDSTTVSAIAAQLHPGIKAFTLGHRGNACMIDETANARATAAMCPMEHIIKNVESQDSISDLSDVHHCYQEPFWSLSANYIICKFVAQNGVRVAMSGLGGDELFGGYRRDLWVSRWRKTHWMAPIMKHMPSLNHHRLEQVYEFFFQKSREDFYMFLFGTFSEKEKMRLWIDADKDWNSVDMLCDLYLPQSLQSEDDITMLCYADMMNYVGNHHLYRGDRFAMRFSLELRFPLLDHELVELAFRMPSYHKVRNNAGKWILRKVARSLIHQSCLSGEKKGFGLPMNLWLRSSLNDYVERNISGLKKRAWFNNQEIERVYQSFLTGRIHGSRIWWLVSFENWLNSFQK